ncbi:MAG TPA: metallophosphoesterase [Trueperaceae bacterium]
MIKVVALGDVHGQWAEVWRALRAAAAADAMCEPTPPVIEGRFQVVMIGDLVHYKDFESYSRIVGEEYYDPTNAEQLKRAAKAQVRELYRFQNYAAKAQGNVSILLGNHDEAALTHQYDLSTRGGLSHDEFNEAKGGLALPCDLADWFRTFLREKIFYGVHFAHAGPLPGMQYFDDFFYHDPDTKHWWRTKPELLDQAGYRFGVYGHTVMEEGIRVDKDHRFAMIDALGKHQFFEMILSDDRLDYRVMQF